MTHTEYNQPQRSGREAQCFKHISQQITENSPFSGQHQGINMYQLSIIFGSDSAATLQIQPKAMVLVMGLGREPRMLLVVCSISGICMDDTVLVKIDTLWERIYG